MNENVDVYVCNPGLGINRSNEAAYIEFEIMDAETQKGTGKTHTVLMPMPDAMTLLRQLDRAQRTFSLEIPTDPLPPMVERSGRRKN